MARGTPGNDTLFGTSADDTLNGRGGDDLLINVGGGSDLFIGGAGQDMLQTDVTGIDDQGFTLLFDAVSGIHGRKGSDIGQDRIKSIESFEMYGDWNVEAIGNGRNNLFRTDAGSDTLRGGGGDDTLLAGAGKDRLLGGAGEDALFGGAGRDILSGGAGDDRLNGGRGNDKLTGNRGADTFDFSGAKIGRDRIKDFDLTEDLLRIDDALWRDMRKGPDTPQEVIDRFASLQGDKVVFDFGGGNRIILDDFENLTDLAGSVEII